MKLYDGGRAPNPRRTRIFLAEKGIKLPLEPVDLGSLQQMSAEYAKINPLKRVPALVLDDATVITESIAICRYFEALQPDPPLFGRGALQIARIEMWNRRLELNLLFPVAHVFRNTHPAMKEMEVPQVPAWAEATKPRIAEFIAIIDGELKERPYIAGDAFSVADITGLVALDFMRPAKLAIADELTHLKRWHAGLSARPSAAA
jgi:glutathione S-transferase